MVAAAKPGEVNPINPGESVLAWVDRGGTGAYKGVGRGGVQEPPGEFPMNVGSFREAPWTGREGVVQGVEMLSRRVVNVTRCCGRCLHVV